MATKTAKKRGKKGDKSFVTQASFARMIGISRPALTKLVQRGDIPLINGKIEFLSAREIIESGRLLNKNGNGNETLAEARLRTQIAKANLLELEFDLKKGETLSRETVLLENAATVKTAQKILRGIPAKVAPLLLALDDETEIQELLLTEIDRALSELSKMNKYDREL